MLTLMLTRVWLCVQEQLHSWTPNCFPTLHADWKKRACPAQAEVMRIQFKQNDLSDPGGAEAQSQSAALRWNQTWFWAEYWTLVWFCDGDLGWHHVMGSSLITRPQREVNLRRGLVGKKLHTAIFKLQRLHFVYNFNFRCASYFCRLYSLHLKTA